MNGHIPEPNEIISLPVVAARTSALVLHLIRSNCKTVDEYALMPEIQRHRLWIDKLLQMLPTLCNLTIIVHTQRAQTCGPDAISALKEVLAPLMELAHLETFEVYKAEGSFVMIKSIEEHRAATIGSLLVMKWSGVGGKWEDVHDEPTAVETSVQ